MQLNALNNDILNAVYLTDDGVSAVFIVAL